MATVNTRTQVPGKKQPAVQQGVPSRGNQGDRLILSRPADQKPAAPPARKAGTRKLKAIIEDDGIGLRKQVNDAANWGYRAAMVPSVITGTVGAFRLFSKTPPPAPVADALREFSASKAGASLSGLDKIAAKGANWLVSKPKAVGFLDGIGGKLLSWARPTLGRVGEWIAKSPVVRFGARLAEEHPMLAAGTRWLSRGLGAIGTVAGLAVAGADWYVFSKIMGNKRASTMEKGLAGGVAGMMTLSAVAGGCALLGLTPFGWGALTMMAISMGTGIAAGYLEGRRKQLTRARTRGQGIHVT